MAKIVKITIDEGTGEFAVDLTGFEGLGCDDVIKAFAEVGEVTKEVIKPEHNRPMKTNVTVGR